MAAHSQRIKGGFRIKTLQPRTRQLLQHEASLMKSAKKILPLPSVPVSVERNLRAVGLYWFISRIVQVRGELFTADYKSSDKIIMSMFRVVL